MREDPIDRAKEVGILGPLLFFREVEGIRETGFRPLFSFGEDKTVDQSWLDLLYPLSTFRRDEEDRRYQFLQLFSTRSEPRARGVTLFPLLFYKSPIDEEPGDFAILPFGGTLRGRFGIDEMDIIMMPLYLKVRRKEAVTQYFIWPLFSYTSDEKQGGIRLFPLYGESVKEGVFERRFALFPIFFHIKSGLDTENPAETLAILPLYAKRRSPKRDYVSILWPLFSKIDEREGGYVRWDYPFPFLSHATGPGRRMVRLFPLFGRDERKETKTVFLLWPAYIGTWSERPEVTTIRHRFFLWLYSDLWKEDREEEVTTRRIDAWPFFTYSLDEEGMINFQLLALLEPFFPGNRGVLRNWSPLWGLYRYRRDTLEDITVHSLLWNLMRVERGVDFSRWEILGPLILSRSKGDEREFSILRGLIGFGRKGERSFFKIFYIRMG